MKTLILIFAFTTAAWAQESWYLGATEVRVKKLADALVNASCEASKCQAHKAVHVQVGGMIAEEGGKNPSSKLCRDHYKGSVFIAQRGSRSQSFCQFSDGSFASLDGLR